MIWSDDNREPVFSWVHYEHTSNATSNGNDQPDLDDLIPLREAAELSGLSHRVQVKTMVLIGRSSHTTGTAVGIFCVCYI